MSGPPKPRNQRKNTDDTQSKEEEDEKPQNLVLTNS